ATATVTAQAPLPEPVYTVAQPNCATALASITISSPAAEYSFDNGLTYGTQNTKTGLAPGSYSLMIKDAAGCFSNVAVATVQPQPSTPAAPQISVTAPSGCAAVTGTVAVISAAALYSFDDGATWTSQA